jgi:hypothetical protein
VPVPFTSVTVETQAMLAAWYELEQNDIDRLSLPELGEAIRRHGVHLPWDLREGIEEQPVENLRMLLLTARLLHLLRKFWKTADCSPALAITTKPTETR